MHFFSSQNHIVLRQQTEEFGNVGYFYGVVNSFAPEQNAIFIYIHMSYLDNMNDEKCICILRST